MNGSIVMMKGRPREFLAEALGNGLLNGQALGAARAVMAENAALRRENAILHGRLREQRRVNQDYRRAFISALRYRFDREEGHRYTQSYRRQVTLAVAGLSAALACLVCSLAISGLF